MTLGIAYAAAHSQHFFHLNDSARDAPQVAGVYHMYCETSGKIYVGQSRNIRERMLGHRCSKHKHVTPIERAIRKYGADAFYVVVLAICPENELDSREQFWIDDLGACDRSRGYNILPGNIAWGEVTRLPVVREAMSRGHADVAGANNPFYGKHHSSETRERMHRRTEIGLEKMAANNKANKGHRVEKVDIASGEVVEQFASQREAALAAGVTQCSMNRGLHRKKEYITGGYLWREVANRENPC
jgi:group I intron endonuclease